MDYTAATVTIAGPGMAFDDIVITIQQALANRGYKLMITNDHPYPVGAEDEILERCKNRTYPIQLVVKHCPWGG